jgi:hypothetical protein
MLVVRRVIFDLGNGERRVFVVEPAARDKIAYHPTATLSIVVEVHQAVCHQTGTDKYDSVVAASSVAVVLHANWHKFA